MSGYEEEWERKMNPRWRGKGRGGRKQNFRAHDNDSERANSHEGQQNAQRPRCPPHLRGREIGMWHARQGRLKKTGTVRKEDVKNRVHITMDTGQERRVTNLLKDLQSSEVVGQNPRSYQLPSSGDESDDGRWSEARNDDGHRAKNEMYNLDYRRKLGIIPEPRSGNSRPTAIDYFDMTCPDETFSGQTSEHHESSATSSGLAAEGRALPEHWWESDSRNSVPDGMPDRGSFGKDINDEGDDSDENLEFVQTSSRVEELEVADAELEYGGKDCDEDADEKLIDFSDDEMDFANFDFDFSGDGKDDVYPARYQNPHSLSRDEKLDALLYDQLNAKSSNEAYRKMLNWRQKLPSFERRDEILNAIESTQVLVISGETGCGKTTQVTQFILDDWIKKGRGSLCRIVCTQPRRISAISIAERVADERVEPLGNSVGYQIRLDSKIPRDQGSILYCTTGIMLKWLESDPWLAKTSHVILDEVHERDILCDFLMIILRDLVQRRPDLKLILMSATLNADLFSAYFGNCPMINIPGYTFPVEELFLEDIIEMIHFVPGKNDKKRRGMNFKSKNRKEEQQKMAVYQSWINQLDSSRYSRHTVDVLRGLTFDSNEIDYDLVSALICFIIRNRPDGAILVFVPGWEQIRKVMDSLNAERLFSSRNFRIIPLHSLMPTVNQREVFERPPPGQRKIIISTNIAETSITIDDVVYVIDCGTMKMKNFDVTDNLSTLQSEWISQANARQRRGRAGRVCSGECFHLYTSFHHSQLEDFQKPEMLRTRLEELCLQIKLLKLGKIKEFVSKAMQPPSLDSLQLAIVTLQDLNALDASEELTPLGYHLAKMPVDPHSGKMLLFAALFSCLDPILTIAASLSFKDAFYVPMGHEQVADERKRQLANGKKSDHLLLVNAFEGWERAKMHGTAYDYCRHNYLSVNTLKMLYNMRRQFAQLLHDMKFITSSDPKSQSSNQNSGNTNLVQAIVCAGLYPNVAKLRPIKNIHSKRPVILDTKHDQKVFIHPKSVNCREREFSSQWFIFHLKMRTTRIFLYDCSPVSPFSLLFFGGNIICRKDLGQNCVVIDNWITFGASTRVASLVQDLRQEFDKLIAKRVTNPCSTNWDKRAQEGALMHAIIDLLTTEELHMPKYTDRKN